MDNETRGELFALAKTVKGRLDELQEQVTNAGNGKAQEINLPAHITRLEIPPPNVTNQVEVFPTVVPPPAVHVEVAAPAVHNQLESSQVFVSVDMTPVAEAQREFAAGVLGVLERILAILEREQKPPSVAVSVPPREPVAYRLEVDRKGHKRIVPES